MPDAQQQPRIKAKLKMEYNDRIHNDLSNGAWYFEKRVRERIAADDREGVGLEMVAALTMSAFAMEANLNFIGSSVINEWDDWASFGKKLKKVLAALKLNPDMTARPYASVDRLKRVRDMLAHGKAQVIKFEEEAIGTHDELTQRLREFKTDWEQLITPDFVSEAYYDVDAIWKEMLTASGIEPVFTWSGGSSGIEFLEYADVQK
jgi:hypothetical protein